MFLIFFFNFIAKAALLLDTQHQATLEKLQMLEDSSKYQRKEDVEVEVKDAPKFVVPLNGPIDLVEGQSAHYECRIEPYPDSTLKLEWFHNNKPLQTGMKIEIEEDFSKKRVI